MTKRFMKESVEKEWAIGNTYVPSGQSRRASMLEAWSNVLIGAVVSLFAQLVIFPAYGVHITLATDLWILWWFTVVSVTRSYLVRRWFNSRTVKGELYGS